MCMCMCVEEIEGWWERGGEREGEGEKEERERKGEKERERERESGREGERALNKF